MRSRPRLVGTTAFSTPKFTTYRLLASRFASNNTCPGSNVRVGRASVSGTGAAGSQADGWRVWALRVDMMPPFAGCRVPRAPRGAGRQEP